MLIIDFGGEDRGEWEGVQYPLPSVVESTDAARVLLIGAMGVSSQGRQAALDAGAVLVADIDNGWCARLSASSGWPIATDLRAPLAPLLGLRGGYAIVEALRDAEGASASTGPSDPFVNVHLHTDFSSLDGLATVDETIATAAALGQDAVCVTDHGVCAAHYELLTKTAAAGMKGVPGLEAYWTPDRHIKSKDAPRYNHLILWALNDTGLRNLWAASTEAYRSGFYHKPRMDWEILERYSEGLAMSTACLGGPLSVAILDDDEEAAVAWIGRSQRIFGDRMWLELHTNNLPSQIVVNNGLVALAKEHSLPLIAAVDSHYACEGDRDIHKLWLSAQTHAKTGKDKESEDSGLFAGHQDYHMAGSAEVRERLSYLPPSAVDEAIASTRTMVDLVHLNPTTKAVAPMFDPKRGREYAEERLRAICEANWERKVTRGKRESEEVYRERYEYELSVLSSKLFIDYFMIVSDYVRFAKEHGVLVGPGRGCLAGDTRIVTQRGLVKIKNVRVGDLVRNRLGRWSEVKETFCYPISEDLVTLRPFFGADEPLALTSDHKVWVRRAHPGTMRGHTLIPGAQDPEWVPAGDVRRGDLMAFPIIAREGNPPRCIDLGRYATSRDEVTSTHVIERVFRNGRTAFGTLSYKAVARGAQVQTVTARRVHQKDSRMKQFSEQRVAKWLASQGVTLEEWREQSMELETAVPRFIRVDEDFCRVLGMWASNGWLRRRDEREIGFASQRSLTDSAPADLISGVFGLSVHEYDHAAKDVVQWLFRSGVVRSLIKDLVPQYRFVAESKHLPSWFLGLNDSCRQALLEGLWWGDGSHKDHSSYATSSPMLRDQVRDLLWSLGMPAGLNVDRRKDTRPGWEKKRIGWRIVTSHNFKPMRRQHGLHSDEYVWVTVDRVGSVSGEKNVYDIRVGGEDPSFTTSSGIVHNSGAGCLVAYLADITEVDSVEYDLMFERFMTKGRVDPPDFDIDFPASKRDVMQGYVADRWGESNTVRVGSVLRMKNRKAVKAARQMLVDSGADISFTAIEEVCRIIEEEESDSAGLGKPWDEVMSHAAEPLAPHVARYPEVFSLASRIVGRVSAYGKHASGLVITTDDEGVPLTERLPLRTGDDSQMVTEFDYRTLESLGFLKFDFLTLRTLDTLQLCADLIQERRGEAVVPYDWTHEYQDPQVWDEICSGHTLGLFQIETVALTSLTRRFQPRSILELSDVITLVRPGPMRSGLTETYLRRRFGQEPVEYLDQRLEPILSYTQGTMIYQEQIMGICRVLAGYDDVESDAIRKLLGKKEKNKVEAAGRQFVAAAVANDTDPEVAARLWEQMAVFALYCLSGDTRIHLAGSGKNSDGTVTVADLYRRLHSRLPAFANAGTPGGGKGRPKSTFTGPCVCCGEYAQGYIRGYCRNKCYSWYNKFKYKGLFALAYQEDGRIRPSRIIDVVENGTQLLWKITLGDGKSIRATAGHRHLTPTGFVEVKDLRVGDVLVIDGGYEMPTKEESSRRMRLTQGDRSQRGVVHGAIGEDNWGYIDGGFTFHRDWKADHPRVCRDCGSASEGVHDVQVAHLDGQHWNNVEGNLAWLCSSCHPKFDYANNSRRKRWEKGHLSSVAEIVSIEPDGEEITYDVVMDEPHNFVANGIVTHNSFGKAHAVSYSLLAAQCAWYRTHYPEEFFTAVLSTADKDRVPDFVAEARKMGFEVRLPDINLSAVGFTPEPLAVRYGLGQIKGVGEAAANAIVAAQPFDNFDDFREKVKGTPANMGVIRTLAAVGAFDHMVPNRRALEARLIAEHEGSPDVCTNRTPVLNTHGLPCSYDWASEPVTLTARGKPQVRKVPARCTKACRHYTATGLSKSYVEPYTRAQIRDREMDMLGVWVSSTPFDRIPEEMWEKDLVDATGLETVIPGVYTTAGVLQKVKLWKDRTGRPMAFLDVLCRYDTISIVVFADAWAKNEHVIKPNHLGLYEITVTGGARKGVVFREFIPVAD